MALVLTIRAGLIVRTITGLLSVNTGFNSQHVLATGIQLRRAKAGQAHPFFADLTQRVRLLPGIQAVAVPSSLPM